MNNEIKDIILNALEMKIASIKRARNSNKSPNFAPVYDLEERQANDAKNWIKDQKTK